MVLGCVQHRWDRSPGAEVMQLGDDDDDEDLADTSPDLHSQFICARYLRDVRGRRGSGSVETSPSPAVPVAPHALSLKTRDPILWRTHDPHRARARRSRTRDLLLVRELMAGGEHNALLQEGCDACLAKPLSVSSLDWVAPGLLEMSSAR
jgi:hypothetical protein